MNRDILISAIIFFASAMFGQNKTIKSAFDNNDLRIAACNPFIEEARSNFKKTGLKNIAVIYWTDEKIGFQKIGITVFENSEQQEKLDDYVVERNKEILNNKLVSIKNQSFKLIETPKSIQDLFKRKSLSSQVKLLDQSIPYLDSLQDSGFDGLFIIYEDRCRDHITGSKIWIPSKGLFKMYNKELVYYGLYSTLINLNTRKIVKNVCNDQFSADYSKIKFQKHKSLTEEQLIILNNQIIERFENNIIQIFKNHKFDKK